MNTNLIKKYLEYTNSDEAHAVLYAKKYLNASKGHWVDIYDYYLDPYTDNPLGFKTVTCQLYKRTLNPKYPPKSQFMAHGKLDQSSYITAARALTWETANTDIEKQKNLGIKGKAYILKGTCLGLQHPKNYFKSDAPDEIKALANHLNDRTSPLWDVAYKYANPPEYVYKLKSVKRLHILEELF